MLSTIQPLHFSIPSEHGFATPVRVEFNNSVDDFDFHTHELSVNFTSLRQAHGHLRAVYGPDVVLAILGGIAKHCYANLTEHY